MKNTEEMILNCIRALAAREISDGDRAGFELSKEEKRGLIWSLATHDPDELLFLIRALVDEYRVLNGDDPIEDAEIVKINEAADLVRDLAKVDD